MTITLILHLYFQEIAVATQLLALTIPLITLEDKAAHQPVLTHQVLAEKAPLHVLIHQAQVTTPTQDQAQVLAHLAEEAMVAQVAEALAVAEEEGKELHSF